MVYGGAERGGACTALSIEFIGRLHYTRALCYTAHNIISPSSFICIFLQLHIPGRKDMKATLDGLTLSY